MVGIEYIEEYHIYLHNTCTAHFKQKVYEVFGGKNIKASTNLELKKLFTLFANPQICLISVEKIQDSKNRLQKIRWKNSQIWTWIYATVYGEEVGQR